MTERWCEFGPLRVGFDESILEPRPWTVVQSRRAVELLETAAPGALLELHCGAGHIGQAAAAWSGRALVQVDDNPTACEWARRNAVANGVRATVRCETVEQLADIDGRFALVLADPPYVPSAQTSDFSADPVHAIDGGDDGLDGVRACLPVAVRSTRPGGAIVLQLRGAEQADVVAQVAAAAGLDLEVRDVDVVSSDRAVVTLIRH